MMSRFIKTALGILLVATGMLGQAVIVSPQEQSVHQLHRIPVIVSGRPGAEVSLYANDSLLAKDPIRIDGLLDFLNVDVPSGPVELRIESKLGNGRILKDYRHVHILGPPAKLGLYGESIEQPADGKTTRSYRFQIQDEWGYKLEHIKVVDFDLTDGQIVSPDLDSLKRGVQVPVQDGSIELEIRSPRKPGKAVLTTTLNGLGQQMPVYYLTPHQPLIIVGTLGAAAGLDENGLLASSGSPFGSLASNGRSFDNGGFLATGRAAFYAKGNIGDQYLLTASLDTDRDYEDQLFQDVDPNAQYPLFGDASTLVYDAQTQSKIFAKLEKDENFVLLGDYETGFNESELTTYNRSLNGALSHLQFGNGKLQTFVSSTDQKMKLDEIRGEGISGYYYLTESNITRFSEKIEIIIRDKYHFDEIIQRTQMTRFQNYDINYVDGTLMFKQPIASMDAAGNPIHIVASYEYRSQQKDALIGGFQYEHLIAGKYTVGSMFVAEDRGSSKYYLTGLNTEIPLSEKLSLKGEVAGSQAPLSGSDETKAGLAYRTSLVYSPMDALFLKAHYRETSHDFTNSSQMGSGLESGSRRYGVNGSYSLDEMSQVLLDVSQQNIEMGTAQERQRRMVSLDYARQISAKSAFKVGFDDVFRRSQSPDSTGWVEEQSSALTAAYSHELRPKLLGVFEHHQDLAGQNELRPSSSSAGLQYQLSESLALSAKLRLIYGEALKNQTIIGLDSKLSENTELIGKYEIGGVTGENRNRASIGLNNHWMVTPDLTLNVAYENVATSDSLELPTREHETISLSAEYLPEAPWKAVSKFEYQDNLSTFKRLFAVAGDARISDGLGVLASYDHYEDVYKSGSHGKVQRKELQLGLAYRPRALDSWNALGKLAYISDANSHIQIPIERSRLIASAQVYWQTLPRLGLSMRFANRTVLDIEGALFSDTSRTNLLHLRGEFDLNRSWSTLFDVRFLSLSPVHETQVGLATELNYAVISDMQIGLGYMFSRFEDLDFSYLHHSSNHFYLSLHLKFDEKSFNWGAERSVP